MANIYKTRDRDAKVITMYVEADQTTSGTTAKTISFNPDYIKGRLNEPYAIEGCLFLSASNATNAGTITFDAGDGSLSIEGTLSSADANITAGGVFALTTSAVVCELPTASAVNNGACLLFKGTWVPTLRDGVTTVATSSNAGTTFTVKKGSWLKFTRLSD